MHLGGGGAFQHLENMGLSALHKVDLLASQMFGK